MKNILSLLLLLLAFTACSDRKVVTDVLYHAEALMDEHPDSSLTLLRTLTSDDFRKEKNRARYALLHSQALDKNYIDVTNDSLISVAVEYYKDKDDVRSKFLSYYYLGRVHANGGNSLKAMLSFTKAEQLEGEIRDSLALGLLYSQLGDLYREYYDFPKSLVAYEKAGVCYGQVSKERHRLYAMLDQAYVFRTMGQIDECFQKLLKVRKEAEYLRDSYLLRSVLGDLLMHYVKEDCIEEAENSFEELKSQFGLGNKTAAFWGCVSRLHAAKNNETEALQALEQGWKLTKIPNDSVVLYCDAAKLYAHFKQPEKAYHCVVKATTLQNRLVQESLQQPVLTAQRDYLSEKLEFEAYRLRMEKHFRFLYILFFIVLLGIVVYVLSKKLKQEKEKARITIDELNEEMQRKEAESNRKVASLLQELERKNQSDIIINSLREELSRRDENLKQYICESESIRRDLQHVANENLVNASQLFRERIELIGEMILSFEEKKDSNINEEIRWWKDKYLVGRKAIAELERQVNMYCQEAMSHFRKEVSMNEEADYHWVCYLFAGVSIKTIAWLMKENKGSVYQRRLRLRSEIESSECLHKELYLRLLGK